MVRTAKDDYIEPLYIWLPRVGNGRLEYKSAQISGMLFIILLTIGMYATSQNYTLPIALNQ